MEYFLTVDGQPHIKQPDDQAGA